MHIQSNFGRSITEDVLGNLKRGLPSTWLPDEASLALFLRIDKWHRNIHPYKSPPYNTSHNTRPGIGVMVNLVMMGVRDQASHDAKKCEGLDFKVR